MLSGKTPFQTYSREASAAEIMQRIKEGEFSFSGPQWDVVSQEAKSVIRGLLTVDPRQRLTMQELKAHPWVQAHNRSIYSSTPLMTPDVLSSLSSPRAAESALNATLEAFHKATRDGFRLLDVSAAPLAQRRKQKKSSTDNRSNSSLSSSSDISSSRTSYSCFSSISTPSKSGDSCHSRQSASSGESNSVFDYSETRVVDYLSTLPSLESAPETTTMDKGSSDNANGHKTKKVVAGQKPSSVQHRPTTRSYKRKQEIALAASRTGNDCIIIEQKAPPPPPPVSSARKMKKARLGTYC